MLVQAELFTLYCADESLKDLAKMQTLAQKVWMGEVPRMFIGAFSQVALAPHFGYQSFKETLQIRPKTE